MNVSVTPTGATVTERDVYVCVRARTSSSWSISGAGGGRVERFVGDGNGKYLPFRVHTQAYT